MKKLLFISIITITIFLSLSTVASAAPFLACDPYTETITASEVKVDGIVQPGIVQACSDKDGNTALCLYDLAGFGAGLHNFEARVYLEGPWPGWTEWSVPFGASKPGAPGLYIIE